MTPCIIKVTSYKIHDVLSVKKLTKLSSNTVLRLVRFFCGMDVTLENFHMVSTLGAFLLVDWKPTAQLKYELEINEKEH